MHLESTACKNPVFTILCKTNKTVSCLSCYIHLYLDCKWSNFKTLFLALTYKLALLAEIFCLF